jgi:hypothetical protein
MGRESNGFEETRRVRPCNLHIEQTLKLTDQMISLADQGDSDREDNGCGILYGVLRDSAYKLKRLAEAEKQNHIRKGWWPIPPPAGDNEGGPRVSPDPETSD